jgi:1,2-diacylglycerol 3-beta-glucosyltransferase
MRAIDVLLAVLALPVLGAAGYLALLALASLWPHRRARGSGEQNFLFVVPAHNEAAGIARTVKSLLAVRYPAARRRVLVVADNCDDDTGRRARIAGARVIERNDPNLRGKGFAIERAFQDALVEGWATALVVIDADSEVNSNFLAALSSELDRGARAVQAASGVSNANDSWRTRLMTVALTLFNGVRSLGRARLGWSAGFRGNGMCITLGLVAEKGYEAFSIAEDLEFGILLGRAGVQVHFAQDARVSSLIASAEDAAATQRLRWEGGRAALAKEWRETLLREAISERSGMLLDLAIDLWVPPLTQLAGALLLGLALSGMVALTGHLVALVSWTAALLLLGVYLARGLALSGVGLGALLAVPRYARWKWSLSRTAAPAEWVRTAREEVSR